MSHRFQHVQHLAFTFRSVLLALCALSFAGCASLMKEQYVVCPYDTVWQAASETMMDRPVTVRNKDKGLIETGWTEMAADERGFGFFGRDMFDNKERARMVLTVKPVNDVTAVVLTENRQRWHQRGGATSQATKWWPVEPSQEAMDAVMQRFDTKLTERGCPIQ